MGSIKGLVTPHVKPHITTTCSKVTCNNMVKDRGLRKADYDVLEHMAAGSPIYFQRSKLLPLDTGLAAQSQDLPHGAFAACLNER